MHMDQKAPASDIGAAPPIKTRLASARSSPGYLIWRSSRLIAALMTHHFRQEDISFQQWLALMLIGNGYAANGTDLACMLGQNSGAITRQIDQLEARGLIARERSNKDRRVVKIVLTEQGQATARALKIRADHVNSEFLDDFTPADMENLLGLVGRLLDKLEDMNGGPPQNAYPGIAKHALAPQGDGDDL